MHAPQTYVERFPPRLEPERRMYAAMLSAADDGIGQILRALDRTGQRENTLIFLAGDNGATTEARAGLEQKPAYSRKQRTFPGFKFSTFDGGMHVPGIDELAGRHPAGQRHPRNRHDRRHAADALRACRRVPVPSDRTSMDGTSGRRPPARNRRIRPIIWANGPQLAVRRGKWKLVINGITYDRTPGQAKTASGR